MPITLPSYVAPNELIQSAWGNAVVNALAEIDNEFVEKAGDTMTGMLVLPSTTPTLANHATRKGYVDTKVAVAGDTMTGLLTVNVTSGNALNLKQGSETPVLSLQTQAGTDLARFFATSTFASIDTFSAIPFIITAPTTIDTPSGSTALIVSAVTETPVVDMQSTAGTSLLKLLGSAAAASTISSFTDMKLRTNNTDAVTIDGSTQAVTTAGLLTIGGNLDHNGANVGFRGSTPISKPTVTGSRGANAALASLLTALADQGLITDSSS